MLVITLVQLDDAQAIEGAESTAARLLPRTNKSANFFFADGPNFGSQFGVAEDQLPATLIVDPDDVAGFQVKIVEAVQPNKNSIFWEPLAMVLINRGVIVAHA